MLSWFDRRALRRFKRVDDSLGQKLRRWIAETKVAPSTASGGSAESATRREDPSFSGDLDAFWWWLLAELRALTQLGESRVAANVGGEGPGQTVDFYLSCGEDEETGTAQLSLHLCPRDPRLGEILMLCEIIRSEDGNFIAWGSGLAHAVQSH